MTNKQTKFIQFRSVPAGSLVDKPDEEKSVILDQLFALPTMLKTMVFSPRTGAYIRGLTKTFNVLPEKAQDLAWNILQISLGNKELAQLSAIISSDLQISNYQAQQIAKDIEKELFAPIILEYNAYLTQNKKVANQTTSMSAKASHDLGGGRNLLDLKLQKSPPLPPPLP